MNKCIFNVDNNICLALTVKQCSKCKFYKSKAEFEEACNKSISICRSKGLCENCKYVRYPCKEVNNES